MSQSAMQRPRRVFDVHTYQEVQSDGLLDLFLASLVVIFFLAEVAEVVGGIMVFLPPALVAIVIAGFIGLRRTITYPRVGTPGDKRAVRSRRLGAAYTVVLGIVAGMAGLAFAGETRDDIQSIYVGAVLAIVSLLVFGALALILHVRRLWLYAALYGLPFLLWAILDRAGIMTTPGPFLAASVATAVFIGSWLLSRFLSEHPRPGRGQLSSPGGA